MTPNNEERSPIFGFLWPVPSKSSEPAISHQTRFVRIGTRGPLRILILVTLAMGIAISAGGVILVGFTTGFSGWTFLSSALLATALVGLARASVSGTYVNDEGIAIRNLVTSRFFPWSQSMVMYDGTQIVVEHSGHTFDTHLGRWSLDWPTGGERRDIAVQAIRTWASAHQSWALDFPPEG